MIFGLMMQPKDRKLGISFQAWNCSSYQIKLVKMFLSLDFNLGDDQTIYSPFTQQMYKRQGYFHLDLSYLRQMSL